MEISLSPLPTEEGVLVSSAIRDITERKRAEVLERSFVPERLPEIPGVQLAARFEPGGAGVEVGGDWYDVLELDGGRIGLVIGDVAGRGVQAAAIMAQLRNALRAYAFESHPPAAALERLNRLAWTHGQSVMATVVYLVFDPSTGLVRLANAGHLPPLRGEAGWVHGVPGGGTVASPRRPARRRRTSDAEYRLAPGSTLLLYTDGLIEKRRTPIDDGLARLAECVGAGHEDLEGLCDRLLETLGPSGEDDVTLLALSPIELAPGRLRAHDARRAPGAGLVSPHPSRLAEAVRGERQGGIRHHPRLQRGGVERDRARIRPRRRFGAGARRRSRGARSRSRFATSASGASDAHDNRGRGLGLIEAIMDSVSVVTSPNEGTEVRMVRELERSRRWSRLRSWTSSSWETRCSPA